MKVSYVSSNSFTQPARGPPFLKKIFRSPDDSIKKRCSKRFLQESLSSHAVVVDLGGAALCSTERVSL